MSNPRIIPVSEIKKNIELYLSQDEKSRIQSISVLSLKEVDAYIDFLEDLRKRCDLDWTSLQMLNNVSPLFYSKKVGALLGKDPNWLEAAVDPVTDAMREAMVSAKSNMAKISSMLCLLKQQKRNLEHLESLKAHLNLKSPLAVSVKKNEKSLAASSSLDEDEKVSAQVDKEGITIKDAQSRIALEALAGYDQLMSELKESQLQNQLLNKKDNEREQVLQQTLDQARRLQADVGSLQAQLLISQEMNLQMEALHTESNQLKSLLESTRNKLSQREEKRANLCIEKAQLIKILQYYKPSFMFFDDPVVKELKKITKLQKESFTYTEIEDCIKKSNPAYLIIFYDPSIKNLDLYNIDTAKLVRVLGMYFKSPPSPGLAMSFGK